MKYKSTNQYSNGELVFSLKKRGFIEKSYKMPNNKFIIKIINFKIGFSILIGP